MNELNFFFLNKNSTQWHKITKKGFFLNNRKNLVHAKCKFVWNINLTSFSFQYFFHFYWYFSFVCFFFSFSSWLIFFPKYSFLLFMEIWLEIHFYTWSIRGNKRTVLITVYSLYHYIYTNVRDCLFCLW